MKSELTQLPPKYADALLSGTDYLFKSLPKVGDSIKVDHNQFWIRLYEPAAKPFPVKLYRIDTRFRMPPIEKVIPLSKISQLPPPGRYNDLYLVYFNGWDFPQAAHVEWRPEQDIAHGGIFGYTIQLSDSNKPLHMPIADNPEWCLGRVVCEIKVVKDFKIVIDK